MRGHCLSRGSLPPSVRGRCPRRSGLARPASRWLAPLRSLASLRVARRLRRAPGAPCRLASLSLAALSLSPVGRSLGAGRARPSRAVAAAPAAPAGSGCAPSGRSRLRLAPLARCRGGSPGGSCPRALLPRRGRAPPRRSPCGSGSPVALGRVSRPRRAGVGASIQLKSRGRAWRPQPCRRSPGR